MSRRNTEVEKRQISPHRTVIWSEPQSRNLKRVPVLYYLSRNGHLQHPHFMEVPLSSPNAPLFLSDVINRLNVLRGKGIASMYSWSCKRSYKNGFVWHDLSENDLIHPAHGHEYVLKGSELPENPFPDPDPGRRRHHSSSSIDFDVSPPPSDSSPETLGTLMKATGREVSPAANRNRSECNQEIQKWRRRSSVLMQLISCGSMGFRGCGAGSGRGLIRQPRGGDCGKGKEYFSGSLVETKKEEFPVLKRSSSYNGDRKTYLEAEEKEIDECVKAKCKPSKAKTQFS